MRPIKELLVLLRETLPGNKEKLFGYSFGEAIREMYLDDVVERSEYHILRRYVDGVCAEYPADELAPRIEFLNKLIDELTTE